MFQTDIDFKGFYSLVCQEKCVVDFHSQCWKQLKEDESLNNDKEFLGRECLTPGQLRLPSSLACSQHYMNHFNANNEELSKWNSGELVSSSDRKISISS